MLLMTFLGKILNTTNSAEFGNSQTKSINADKSELTVNISTHHWSLPDADLYFPVGLEPDFDGASGQYIQDPSDRAIEKVTYVEATTAAALKDAEDTRVENISHQKHTSPF